MTAPTPRDQGGRRMTRVVYTTPGQWWPSYRDFAYWNEAYRWARGIGNGATLHTIEGKML